MMGVGNELVQPQLSAGEELSGGYINKIFTQRSIWLVPSENLEGSCKDEVQYLFALSLAHTGTFNTQYIQ